MKKTIVILALAAMCTFAEAQVQTPLPSPKASVSSVVGLTEVKIDYYRPRLRGRKIFGEKDVMYPYGTIWRTGANDGTKISFSTPVKVEGIEVAAGEYIIFTWPGAREWAVVLYSDASIGGNTNRYDASKEAARFNVKPNKLKQKAETFTISIADIAADNKSATITLAWEDVEVPIRVEVDYDELVMQSIAANTRVNPRNYFESAVYYLETGRDLKQALTWIDLALESNPKAFWMLYQKARIQKALGDKEGAIKTATASLEAAREAKNRDYQTMNEELIRSVK